MKQIFILNKQRNIDIHIKQAMKHKYSYETSTETNIHIKQALKHNYS